MRGAASLSSSSHLTPIAKYKFRPPDIAQRKNVRFWVRSGDRGNGHGGAALARRTGEGQPDTWWRPHCEPNPQAGAGEDCRRLIEHLAEGLGGVRSMRRAERSQGDLQLAIADADVAGGGEELMQQGSPLMIDTGVVRSQQRKQIAFGL